MELPSLPSAGTPRAGPQGKDLGVSGVFWVVMPGSIGGGGGW